MSRNEANARQVGTRRKVLRSRGSRTSSRSRHDTEYAYEDNNFDVQPDLEYRIVNLFAILKVISRHVKCKTCGSNVVFSESSPRGLGFKIGMTCRSCPKVQMRSSPLTSTKNHYDVNHRMTLTMRLLGVGLNGINKFCSLMELPRPIFNAYYDKAVNAIASAASLVRRASTRQAAREEKSKSEECGLHTGIAVTDLRSWKKCGLSTIFGFSSIIGIRTGKIIDVEVNAKYCLLCKESKNRPETQKYEEWIKAHAEFCLNNHSDAIGGKVEINDIVGMFERSEKLYGLQYVNYVGDSLIFKGIVESEPYETFHVRCTGSAKKKKHDSILATFWNMAPQSPLSGSHLLDIAADLAVINFNEGLISVLRVMKVLGMNVGHGSHDFCFEADDNRIQYNERMLTDPPIDYAALAGRPSREEDLETLEGQLYGFGISD